MPAQQRFYDMYSLASRARYKLQREADEPEHNLRLLVGHANLLDSLTEELRLYSARDSQMSRYTDLFQSLDDDSDSEEDELDEFPAMDSHHFGTSSVVVVEGEDYSSQDLTLQRCPPKRLRSPLLPTPIVGRATRPRPKSIEKPEESPPADPTCHSQDTFQEAQCTVTDGIRQACSKLTSMVLQPSQEQSQATGPKSAISAATKLAQGEQTAAAVTIRWSGMSLLATVRAA